MFSSIIVFKILIISKGFHWTVCHVLYHHLIISFSLVSDYCAGIQAGMQLQAVLLHCILYIIYIYIYTCLKKKCNQDSSPSAMINDTICGLHSRYLEHQHSSSSSSFQTGVHPTTWTYLNKFTTTFLCHFLNSNLDLKIFFFLSLSTKSHYFCFTDWLYKER